MIKHIIIWNFRDDLSDAEKSEYALKIKMGLEDLLGVIDGLVDIKVCTDFLDSSNGELLLDSTFKDEQSLKDYQINPKHLKIAKIVRSVVSERKCVDFEINIPII